MIRNLLSTSHRAAFILCAAFVLVATPSVNAETDLNIKVAKRPSCGCCNGWVEHLKNNGFKTEAREELNLTALKARLGVPKNLASCHTAEIEGYVIEGHVPAAAIRRLLAERPEAVGLAVPGMPIGSPGMEGGEPETYDVILFSNGSQQTFGRYRTDKRVSE